MRVLISGASGLVGTELTRQLVEQGHEAIRLVRRAATSAEEIEWHPETGSLDATALTGIDAVVNLAGATTGKIPWTKAYKQEIINSRLDSTRTLVKAIKAAKGGPKILISGSASGFYGDSADRYLSEASPKGSGFLSDLSAEWESVAQTAPKSVRVVLIRTTMVLSRQKGALGRLLPLLRLGVGGPLGTGLQWWAWISVVDEAAAIMHLIKTKSAVGAYNLTAPEPATAADVVVALAKALHRPAWFKVPAFALRLAFGEAADELLLCSQKMSADKLMATGFMFTHPTLQSACDWVVGRK
jgi:uncharacterized protein (TIGR01777 family)